MVAWRLAATCGCGSTVRTLSLWDRGKPHEETQYPDGVKEASPGFADLRSGPRVEWLTSNPWSAGQDHQRHLCRRSSFWADVAESHENVDLARSLAGSILLLCGRKVYMRRYKARDLSLLLNRRHCEVELSGLRLPQLLLLVQD